MSVIVNLITLIKLSSFKLFTCLQSYYSRVPPSIARFSSEEPDVIAYTGYGMQKQIQYHSMQQRKVFL